MQLSSDISLHFLPFPPARRNVFPLSCLFFLYRVFFVLFNDIICLLFFKGAIMCHILYILQFCTLLWFFPAKRKVDQECFSKFDASATSGSGFWCSEFKATPREETTTIWHKSGKKGKYQRLYSRQDSFCRKTASVAAKLLKTHYLLCTFSFVVPKFQVCVWHLKAHKLELLNVSAPWPKIISPSIPFNNFRLCQGRQEIIRDGAAVVWRKWRPVSHLGHLFRLWIIGTFGSRRPTKSKSMLQLWPGNIEVAIVFDILYCYCKHMLFQ